MANKKISELPYINGGEISGNTLVPLVTYYSATTGDTVHTYITDLQNYLTSGITVSGNYLPLSGGTVTGQTIFNQGLTATTISATTYQNLPISGLTEGNYINISGSNGNYTVSVTGLTQGLSGDYLPLSGGTVTGNTVFTQNISVTGVTGINWFSGNTSTDLLRVTQTGVGNAFVVDDSTNPDSTPFVINSGGSVSIGTTSVFSVGAGAETKLNVSTGSSGVATTGLSVSTPVIIESTVGTSIGLFNPDVANSQMYFGTPSDAFGAFLRWDYTNRNLILSTANGTGKLIFQTANGVEVARIDQSGNMGIGLTGATQKLEVSGNTLVYGNLELTSENTTSIGNILRFRDSDSVVTPTTEQFIGKIEFFSNENTGGGTGVKSYIAGVQDASANSSIVFATTGGTGTLTGSSTTIIGERMRITSTGNVGIGTTSPSEKLQVSGNVLISNTLSATTISATTYQNLPNSLTGLYLPTSGGTVSGNTIFTSGLTATTLNISSTPTTDTGTTTNVLVRDISTGVIKQRDITSTLNKNYASFYDTGDQTGLANTVLTMSANTSDSWNTGITLSANTRFVIQNPGVYNLAFSAQMVKTGGNSSTHAHIWLYQNGLDVLYSASQIGFPSNTVYVVPAWNFFFSTTTPNEYVELKWEINSNVDNQLSIKHQPAAGSVPAIPSLIVTINQVN
jgi:hypothetical protein